MIKFDMEKIKEYGQKIDEHIIVSYISAPNMVSKRIKSARNKKEVLSIIDTLIRKLNLHIKFENLTEYHFIYNCKLVSTSLDEDKKQLELFFEEIHSLNYYAKI